MNRAKQWTGRTARASLVVGLGIVVLAFSTHAGKVAEHASGPGREGVRADGAVARSPAGGTGESRAPSFIPRPDGAGGGIAGGAIAGNSYVTGFEPGEGFAPGHIDGQAGWTSFASSSTEAHIDTIHFDTGVQHLRVSNDPSLPINNNVGAFSPNLGTFEGVSAIVSVEVAISAIGGADYRVVPQSQTEQDVVTQVIFRRTGEIFVEDTAGFVNTGATWVPGPYRNLTIDLDVGAGTIEISYDGILVYSMGVPFATSVQEVVLFSNNANETNGDVGDFDNLTITGGPLPTGACCNSDGMSGCEILDPDTCIAQGGAYLGNDTLCAACPMGACCNQPGDICTVMTPEECASIADAFYLGDATICDDCPTVFPSCGPGAGPCLEGNGTPGCEDIECCALTCDVLPDCCVVEWTQVCADAALDTFCVPDPACGIVGTGDCFVANGTPYCEDTCGKNGACDGCCDIVCVADPYCCALPPFEGVGNWDAFCVAEAEQLCTLNCGPGDIPANDECVDAITVTLGDTPFSNVCSTPGCVIDPECDGFDHTTCNDGFLVGLGYDVWFTHNATFTGDLRITTCDLIDFNSQIAVYEGCGDCGALSDPPLACNDDLAICGGGSSQVEVPVVSGQCYTIRVGSSYLVPFGTGTLRLEQAITPPACIGGTGNCLAANGSVGCDDETCCSLVCATNSACCDVDWDQVCADLAAELCQPKPCGPIDVSAASVIENEPCGTDIDGGCNSTPPVFVDIASGDVIHGTAWADFGTRDTDWYRISVTAEDDVDGNGSVDLHYNVLAELPIVSFAIIDPDAECGGDETVVGATSYSQSCAQITTGLATVDAPGTHYVFAGTGDEGGGAIFDGYPCPPPGPAIFGNNYLLCVTVTDDGVSTNTACPASTCLWDCVGDDGIIGIDEFLGVLGLWGSGHVNEPCDFDGDGTVGIDEFLKVLGLWGTCP